MPSPIAIIVHGGAWAIPDASTSANLLGTRLAAERGHAVLAGGGNALDAVEAAVRVLEDDASFAAGVGSCLTAAGTVELDAAVMSAAAGGTPRAGAVACAGGVRNAVVLARAVLERTEHVLLAGAGADAFAADAGVERVPNAALVTPAAREEWARYARYGDAVADLFRAGHDTVGAAAVDRAGGVAAATSTGGITFKRPGRVGDSPVVGAGLFADAGVGACSTTGHGESILKTTLARYALWQVEHAGCSAQEAAEEAVRYMKRKTGGCGGLIIVDQKGDIGFAFSTARMAWAAVDRHGNLTGGIDPGDGSASGVVVKG